MIGSGRGSNIPFPPVDHGKHVTNEAIYEASPPTNSRYSSFDAPFENSYLGFSRASPWVSDYDHHQNIHYMLIVTASSANLCFSPLPEQGPCLVDGILLVHHVSCTGSVTNPQRKRSRFALFSAFFVSFYSILSRAKFRGLHPLFPIYILCNFFF